MLTKIIRILKSFQNISHTLDYHYPAGTRILINKWWQTLGSCRKEHIPCGNIIVLLIYLVKDKEMQDIGHLYGCYFVYLTA